MASKTTKSAGSRKNAGARSNTGSRKTSAARTSSVKKNSSAARKSSSYRSPDPVMNTEILCWCLLGASAVMFICVIGFGGKIGNAFGDLLFGIMGTNAYLFPFLVFFLTLYLMMTHGERFAKIRAISCIVLFCVLCGVWQLISYSGLTGSSVSDYFEVGQQYHTGGGAIGGALILFFVISGAGLDLGVLTKASSVLIGLVYILSRALGKYLGARGSARLMKCDKTVVDYLGITLFPQAGVALGMCVTAAVLPDGALIRNIILFAVLIYELIGPLLTKWALTRAGDIKPQTDEQRHRRENMLAALREEKN